MKKIKEIEEISNSYKRKLMHILKTIFVVSNKNDVEKLIINPELTLDKVLLLQEQTKDCILNIYTNCERYFIEALLIYEELYDSKFGILQIERLNHLNNQQMNQNSLVNVAPLSFVSNVTTPQQINQPLTIQSLNNASQSSNKQPVEYKFPTPLENTHKLNNTIVAPQSMPIPITPESVPVSPESPQQPQPVPPESPQQPESVPVPPETPQQPESVPVPPETPQQPENVSESVDVPPETPQQPENISESVPVSPETPQSLTTLSPITISQPNVPIITEPKKEEEKSLFTSFINTITGTSDKKNESNSNQPIVPETLNANSQNTPVNVNQPSVPETINANTPLSVNTNQQSIPETLIVNSQNTPINTNQQPNSVNIPKININSQNKPIIKNNSEEGNVNQKNKNNETSNSSTNLQLGVIMDLKEHIMKILS